MISIAKERPSSIRTFDWTVDQSSAASNDFKRCTREHVAWKTSPLGLMAQWPSSLRQMVLLSMADLSPSAVLYGPMEQVAIVYNEPFATLLASKHPVLQGQQVAGQLLELCPDFDATWQRQYTSGTTEVVGNQRIRQDRLGFVEEKTYAWKFVPTVGEDGLIVGSLVTVEEENRPLPRRERSKSAASEFERASTSAIEHTSMQATMNFKQLDERFTGRGCHCEELWKAIKQIEYNEAKYEKFANYAPVAIAALDSKSYELEWANKAYYDVTSQPPNSKSFLDYVHPDDVHLVQGRFDVGAFQDGSFTFECRLKKWARPAVSPSEAPAAPSPAWVLVSAFRENEGREHIMCWIIDITAHKNAEDVLRVRMAEAMEMKQQKERFIDMISHEIRNPLSAMVHCTDDIIENVEDLRNGRDTDMPASILENAATIAYCTQHIQNIVGDVLTLSKLDSRLVDVCPKPSQPREVVQGALKIFQNEFRANSIELDFAEDPSMQALRIDWLLFDPNRLVQVLVNLVTNAINVVKSRVKRKVTVRLSAVTRSPYETGDDIQCVRPRQTPKPVDFGGLINAEPSVFVVISVEDTGPGLEPEEKASLFERFAQASPKTESKYGGSGLGLFISRFLTELQNGTIGVASEPGVGSKFVFSVEAKRTTAPSPPTTSPPAVVQIPSIEIPTRLRSSVLGVDSNSPVLSIPSPHALHGHGVTRTQQQQQPPPPQPQQDKSAPRRVLVVEDNLVNQKVLANQLRKRGYEVGVALHGEEALELLQMTSAPSSSSPSARAFDVVLMDLEMPVMDGVSCVERIRAFEKKHGEEGDRLPVIAVTANARSEHATVALGAGMDAITTKPYRIQELVAEIGRVSGSGAN
ncbi:histidine kinase [Lecanosticta acicola]|uniref:histidine kinase n=1 Tax=Lecanosticta acicola TaxID=111012 RepID=A0AAI8Z056_9PEZI|nr:histidine kinase [Lecanosticta acicola]